MRTPKTFSGEEEHQILQRLQAVEDKVAEHDDQITEIKTDLGVLHDANQQSLGGKAMMIAAGGALGFVMSVVTFYLSVQGGGAQP
jgi:selenophosphate synthetase-related protein